MGFVDVFGLSVPSEAAFLLVLEILLGSALLAAFVLAARHKGLYHHWAMLLAFVADELVAKPLMVQRLSLGVMGDFPYEGTMALPHVTLSVIGTVSGIATILLGFRYRVRKEKRMFLPPGHRKIHRLVGIVFLTSWFASLLLGLRIFLQSYGG